MMKRHASFYVLALLLSLALPSAQSSAYVIVKRVSIGPSAADARGTFTLVTMNIPAGLQVFALPGEPFNPMTAQSLIDLVREAGGNVTLFTRLNDQGAFEPYIQGLTLEFNLLEGRGYIISNAKACAIKIRVKDKPNITPLSLRKGINMISLPMGTTYAASSFLNAVNVAGASATYVIRCVGGQFRLYYPSLPSLATPDFPLDAGSAYIVGCGNAIVWTPAIPAGKTPKPKESFPVLNPPSEVVAAGTTSSGKTAALAAKAPVVTDTSSAGPAARMELEKAIGQQLNLRGSNRPPIFLAVGDKTVKDKDYSDRLISLDLDSDGVNFSTASTPAGFSFDKNSGHYRWSIRDAKKGVFKIPFRASDGKSVVEQVATFTVQKNILRAYYPMGGNAVDATGNNHGRLIGAPRPVMGVAGSALEFRDGQRMLLNDRDGFLKGVNGFTVAMWVKVPSTNIGNTYQTLFARTDGNYSRTGDVLLILSWTGRIEATVNVKEMFWGAPWPMMKTAFSNAIVRPNQWTHVALTFDSGTAKLYINGALDAQFTPWYGKGDMDSVSKPMCVANLPAGGHQTRGVLDEIWIYDGALSDQDIQSMFRSYNSTKK